MDEQRIAKIEGRIFAHNAIIAAFVGRLTGYDENELRLVHGIVTEAIEKTYERSKVTDLGHIALQAALETADALLEPSKDGSVVPRSDPT